MAKPLSLLFLFFLPLSLFAQKNVALDVRPNKKNTWVEVNGKEYKNRALHKFQPGNLRIKSWAENHHPLDSTVTLSEESKFFRYQVSLQKTEEYKKYLKSKNFRTGVAIVPIITVPFLLAGLESYSEPIPPDYTTDLLDEANAHLEDAENYKAIIETSVNTDLIADSKVNFDESMDLYEEAIAEYNKEMEEFKSDNEQDQQEVQTRNAIYMTAAILITGISVTFLILNKKPVKPTTKNPFVNSELGLRFGANNVGLNYTLRW